jgi:hypothetical protein
MVDHRRESDQRPSPEALLEAARREERRSGRLKIFVGAAPGVGKTYEMLQQARASKEEAMISWSASWRRMARGRGRLCSTGLRSLFASASE